MKIDFSKSPEQNKESVFSSLEESFAQNTITVDEYEHRLESVIAAVDNAAIASLAEDLPAPPAVQMKPRSEPEQNQTQNRHSNKAEQTESRDRKLWHGKASSTLLSIFGGATRKGAWHVPRVLFMFSLFGGNEIDFTNAVFPNGEVQIANFSLFGGNTIYLRGNRTDLPKITITSFSLFGGTELKMNKAEHLPIDGIHADALSVFGGFDVNVPNSAGVTCSGVGIFGGSPNVGLAPETDQDGYIDIKSLSIFGGVSVKNASGKNL